jgi:hypothetical protein
MKYEALYKCRRCSGSFNIKGRIRSRHDIGSVPTVTVGRFCRCVSLHENYYTVSDLVSVYIDHEI